MAKTNKREAYRAQLRALGEWLPFLLQESGLPGPRGNIELGQAVAEEGNEELFLELLSFDARRAPANTPDEFLHFCGVLGLGRLLAEGRRDLLTRLRALASDPRWRTREAVAMALQRWGRVDIEALLDEMARWAGGAALEQRAAVAALCEPDLLRTPAVTERVLALLDRVTGAVAGTEERDAEDLRVLRQGLGYAWSVAVAAYPSAGKGRMEAWLSSADRDVRWIMRENLKKNRLARLDPAWVDRCLARLSSRG